MDKEREGKLKKKIFILTKIGDEYWNGGYLKDMNECVKKVQSLVESRIQEIENKSN